MRILVVEDDKKTGAFLDKGLRENGFTVDVAPDGELGLDHALSHDYDLVILDVMLPKLDGFGVLEAMRKSGKEAPVIFLSAKDAVSDRVRALDGGGDAYLVKPFAFAELLALTRTVLRRGPGRAVPETLRVGGLEIDIVRHRAAREGKRLDLTPKEFMLLTLLARRAGEVVSRTVIADQVWGINFDCETNVVDVHMRRLRAKVDDPFEEKMIQTVRGVGYLLERRSPA